MSTQARSFHLTDRTSFIPVLIAIACLHFGRSVFIPLALAVVFAFLFGPLVARLRHWGIHRVPATLAVVSLSFGIMTIVCMIMTSQISDVLRKLPQYEANVKTKLHSIRTSGGGVITRMTRTIDNLVADVSPPPPPSAAATAGDKPVPVEIRKAPFAPLELAQKILGSLVSTLLTLAVVVVFVIFMLIQREDLRDRFLRLVGEGRVQVTTEAMDDAAQRLSRYLLAQLVVNFAFGTLAAVGLYFLHVPNPLLWGMLAALLRYIPYLGIWIAAILPAVLAFAVDPGWVKVPLIFGLYLAIDLVMYNFVEPLLYGSSTGISPFAILVAAIFWTWLWGPVGLLLATPLTVCVVVLGRYVPSLEFLSVLLSDEEVLPVHVRFYQRLLARDVDEAAEIATTFMKGKTLEEVGDELLLPALKLAEADRHKGKLDEDHQLFLQQNTRALLEDIVERSDELTAGEGAKVKANPPGKGSEEAVSRAERINEEDATVICIPARDEGDEIAALFLCLLLQKRGLASRTLSSNMLSSECLQAASSEKARVACVMSVPPFGHTPARYLTRRLKTDRTGLKVVAAVLTGGDVAELKQRQPAIAADELATTFKQALATTLSLAHADAPATQPVLHAA